MDIFLFLCFLFLFLLPLYIYHHLSSTSYRKNLPKGFKTYPMVGAMPPGVRVLEWTTQVLKHSMANTAILRRPGKLHGVITANPDNVEYILKTNFDNYPKGKRTVKILQDFLGQGIFSSDRELWRLQRKTASNEFSTKSVRSFIMNNVRVKPYTRLIPMLNEAAKRDRILDLQDMLERFAFDNICKLAFNYDPGYLSGGVETGADFMQAFEDAAILIASRFMYSVPYHRKLMGVLNIGSERRLKKAISVVHEFADSIIRTRLENRADLQKEDLLSRFNGNDESSPEFLRGIIISFIVAGRGTTSSALTWFFRILCSNPEVEQSILKELKEIRRRNQKQIGDSYSMEELRDMNYLHAAISEAMWLYPPVPVGTKACLSDDVLPDGTFIRKGWFVTYNTYAMGRMQEIWGADSEKFQSERWLDEKGSCRRESPFRYPVFHAGPRMCLGKDIAYIQMKSIAAAVIERFVVEVAEKEKSAEHLLSLTLRMKGGLPMRLRETPT